MRREPSRIREHRTVVTTSPKACWYCVHWDKREDKSPCNVCVRDSEWQDYYAIQSKEVTNDPN